MKNVTILELFAVLFIVMSLLIYVKVSYKLGKINEEEKTLMK